MSEEIPVGALPSYFFEAVMHDLAQFSIGFVDVINVRDSQDVFLRGSGTLVQAGQTYAILTAHHVLEVLPRSGRLGLILAPSLHQTTINVAGVSYLKIGRGQLDAEGPDLGAVMLSTPIAAALAAKKRFYGLDQRRTELLERPPNLDDGVWFVHGFLDERTRMEPPQDGYSAVKQFYSFSGAGGPDAAVVSGDYDYFTFPVTTRGQPDSPVSYGGMSGGGLWQVPFSRKPNGEFVHKNPILSGVVFYQFSGPAEEFHVRCHGRQSVYDVVYSALRNSEP